MEDEKLESEGTRARSNTAMFTMDDSDGSVTTEDAEDGERGEGQDLTEIGAKPRGSISGGARLSLMFEHNDMMNMRINALANDLRNGMLLPQEDTEPEPLPINQRRRSRPSVSFRLDNDGNFPGIYPPSSLHGAAGSGFSPSARTRRNLMPKGQLDSSPSAASEVPMTGGGSIEAELRRHIEELEKKLKAVNPGSVERDEWLQAQAAAPNEHKQDTVLRPVGTSSTSQNGSVAISAGRTPSCPYAEEMERLTVQAQMKKMNELRAELSTERSRASQSDKENAGLRKDLLRCQHVIERLVKELELATMDKNTKRPAAPQSAPSTVNDGSRPGEASTGLEPVEAEAIDGAPAGFMSDLSSALGSFFGQLGTERAASEMKQDDSDDEPFSWAADPCGRNVQVSDDGLTATFVGKEKSDLHAFVVTEEPPLLEADQGYGFEIQILNVRSLQEEDGLAIGFTATPPDMWPEDLPETADIIDTTFLVGYNGEMWDGGAQQWHKCPWSPAGLVEGDRVGVQVSLEGKLFVVLNQEVVFSTNISVAPDGPPLYGVVDLLGNTDSVLLLD